MKTYNTYRAANAEARAIADKTGKVVGYRGAEVPGSVPPVFAVVSMYCARGIHRRIEEQIMEYMENWDD